MKYRSIIKYQHWQSADLPQTFLSSCEIQSWSLCALEMPAFSWQGYWETLHFLLAYAASNTFFFDWDKACFSQTRFSPTDLGGAPQGWHVCDGCHSETNKSETGKREEAQENANDASAEQWIEALRQQKMITNPNRSKEVDIRRKPKRQGIILKRISNPRYTHIFDPMEISLLKRTPSTLEKASMIGLTFLAKIQARKSKDPNVDGSNQDVWRFNK